MQENISVHSTDEVQKNVVVLSSNILCETMIGTFENHLKSMKFDYTKIHSIVCQKDNIKVELALSQNGSVDEIFARVYVNDVRESDCKWDNCFKRLWKEEVQNVRKSQFFETFRMHYLLQYLRIPT